MITRIEIDGFKSFADFGLDLPPFLAVIGTNASGKPNLVEALAFVSTAWRRGLDDAVAAIRGARRRVGAAGSPAEGSGLRAVVDEMTTALERLGYQHG